MRFLDKGVGTIPPATAVANPALDPALQVELASLRYEREDSEDLPMALELTGGSAGISTFGLKDHNGATTSTAQTTQRHLA